MRAKAILFSVCVLFGAVLMAGEAKLAGLLDKMHKVNSTEGQPVLAEILKLGPDAVREICGMVLPPGKGNDANAHYALHGLALYVVRPGAEAERKLYADVLIQAMEAASDRGDWRPVASSLPATGKLTSGSSRAAEVKAFFVRQLQLAGRDEAVPPLAKLLASAEQYEPATQALIRIGTPAAVEAIAKALPEAKGPRRLTFVRALGRLRCVSVAKAILPDAASNDRDLRLDVVFALANIGDPSAGEALAKAADAASPYERSQATAYYILYATRRAEAGDKAECARICRELMKTRTAPRERNVCTSALATLVAAVGADAVDDLMTAMESKDPQIRAAALALTESMPGEAMTARWVERLKTAAPPAKAEILGVLARRGDKAALPAVMDALKSTDKAVRLAAIPAVAGLGGDQALSALLTVLTTAGEADEAKAVQTALMQLSGEDILKAAAEALARVPPPARGLLLEVLAVRKATAHVDAVVAATKDADGAVRLAALKALGELADEKTLPRLVALLLEMEGGERAAAQRAIVAASQRIADPEARADALLAALGTAKGEQRAILLSTLARVGGKKALEAAVADTKSGDAAVQEAAIRALCDWPDASAAPALLDIARTSPKLVHQVLALRGFVRVVGDSDLTADQKLKLLKDAMGVAKRPEEQKLVLAGLAGVKSVECLTLVAQSLGTSDLDEGPLQAEAAAAAVDIACPSGNQEGLRGSDVVAILKRAIAVSKDAAVRKRAQDYIDSMPRPDEANVAQGKPVKTNVGQQGGNSPDKAVDGNAADKTGSAWFGQRWPCWLEVDLQQPTRIDAAQVFFYWDSRYFQYTLETSLDGKAWKIVVDASKNTTPGTERGVFHKFAPVEARYVRLNILKNSANEAVHLVELKVYAAGKSPAKNP